MSKTSQCWFKLRKRKMSATTTSAATYMPAAYNASQKMNGTKGRMPSKPSPLPLEIETLEEVQTPESHDDDNHHFHHHHHPDEIKSQFPNSATMDSGVEDCCEPPLVQPSIDLDETQGKRVSVKMVRNENQGFGFSVVWVSPPRIERLEKDKTADLAGLRIGDLIIGVNGEDVTTVPNTTIYHNMKTTGNELQLEVWRKNPPPPTPATVVKSNNPQIGSMVMMLMTGTGSGHNLPKPPSPKPTFPANHHSNVANNNVAISSPRHGKQPSSLSSNSTPHSSTPPVVLTGNTNNAPASSNNNTSQSHHNHHSSPAGQQQQQQLQQQQPQQQTPQHQQLPQQQQQLQQQPQHPQAHPTTSHTSSHTNIPLTTANINVSSNNNNPPIRVQLPPVSILKPPPPAPPTTGPPISSPLITSHNHLQRSAMISKKLPAHPQPTLNSSSWRIRFNVEVGQGTYV